METFVEHGRIYKAIIIRIAIEMSKAIERKVKMIQSKSISSFIDLINWPWQLDLFAREKGKNTLTDADMRKTISKENRMYGIICLV